jgi:hypothetical protein
MDEAGSPTTLLRFDLDGHDSSRWKSLSERFVAEIRRLTAREPALEPAPALRQFLHRLPPRGVDSLAARRDLATARRLEIAERIIERYRAREAATLAAIREDPAAIVEKLSERPSELATTLQARRAFLAGDDADRDLVVDGDELSRGGGSPDVSSPQSW